MICLTTNTVGHIPFRRKAASTATARLGSVRVRARIGANDRAQNVVEIAGEDYRQTTPGWAYVWPSRVGIINLLNANNNKAADEMDWETSLQMSNVMALIDVCSALWLWSY